MAPPPCRRQGSSHSHWFRRSHGGVCVILFSINRAGARHLSRQLWWSAGNDTVAARAAAASTLESDSGHSGSYPACGGGSQGGLFLPEEVAGGAPGQLPRSFVFNELSRAEILAMTKAVVRASVPLLLCGAA